MTFVVPELVRDSGVVQGQSSSYKEAKAIKDERLMRRERPKLIDKTLHVRNDLKVSNSLSRADSTEKGEAWNVRGIFGEQGLARVSRCSTAAFSGDEDCRNLRSAVGKTSLRYWISGLDFSSNRRNISRHEVRRGAGVLQT